VSDRVKTGNRLRTDQPGMPLSISTLPSDPDEQRKFAIRFGHQEIDVLRRDYLDSREAIHALYQQHITPA